MVSGNEIPRDPQVPAFLANRPPLLRRLDGGDGKGHPTGGAQVDVRPREPQGPDVPQGLDRRGRAIRSEDDELGALRLRRATDLPEPEPHIPGVGCDAQGAGDINHGATSSIGSSGSAASAGAAAGNGGVGAGTGTGTGFGFGTADGFGSPAGGW